MTKTKPKAPTKKSNVTIKEYVVVRENGRIKSMREVTPTFTIKEARAKYASDKSLSEDVKITFLSKVKETVDMRKNAKSPKQSYQVVASIQLHGQTVTARSDKREWSSLSDAKQNALDHLYGIIAVAETGESDKGVGESIAKDIGGIRTGIVYYSAKEQATA